MQQVASYLRGSLAKAPLLLSRHSLLPASSFSCPFSTKLVDVSYDSGKGIATLRMKHSPVNSLSLDFMTDMSIALDKLHNDKQCRALVLTSEFPKTFSAGLHLNELYQTKREKGMQFFETFQDMCLRLYTSRLVTIAAINGHAIAGGYVLTMLCDSRIMAKGPFKLGLNETLLGLALPFWVGDMYADVCGIRFADRASQLGLLFSPEEAKAANMVDQLVDGAQMAKAVDSELEKWLKIPDAARQLTKGNFRQRLADQLVARKKEDAERFVSHFMSDSVQQLIAGHMAKIKSQKKSKKGDA